MPLSSDYRSAVQDFQRLRQQAALQEAIGRLTGRSTSLLSYEEVAEKLKLAGRADRGLRQIPLRAIVGSVGRYTDFTRTFLPRQAEDEARWASVKTAVLQGRMPPIEVYQVGEAYFVLDGNHRVSIARQSGMEFIDAYVIEVRSPVPLGPEVQPDDLIIKAEQAEFMTRTRLADLVPDLEITLTAPGQYLRLAAQIEAVRASQPGSSFEQAARRWHDELYLPLTEAIREQGLLRWFPGRTEADLAVRRSGRAGTHTGQTGVWRKARMAARYIEEHLFRDILVPLNGREDGWEALEQAVAVAAREDARIHGLHVLAEEEQREAPRLKALRDRCAQVCERAAVRWDFSVEAGDTVRRINERARLTDLVVLNTAHPPRDGLPALRSGLHAIIWKCPRPLLATCCSLSPLNRALLAFDGSPKSREALFVAAYLAEQWLASLTVLTLTGERHGAPGALDSARAYLELHEVLHHLDINLLLMGGYGGTALEEVMAGSLVNLMLRTHHCPIFICR